MPFSKTRKIIQRGTRANQPLASSVQEGTLYYVTDEDKVERSNGSTWDGYGNAFLIGGSNTQVQFNDSGVLGGDAGLTYNKTTDILSAIGGYKERSRTIPLGEWTDVPYNAGDYTASGSMTWTVAEADVFTFKYTVIGKTLIVIFSFVNTTVGGTPATRLEVVWPGGFSPTSYHAATMRYNDNGTGGNGFWDTSSTHLRFQTGANWALSTDNTGVFGIAIVSIS